MFYQVMKTCFMISNGDINSPFLISFQQRAENMDKLFHDFVEKEDKNTNTTVKNDFCKRLLAII